MPLNEQARHLGLADRILEITSTKAPWHRRLWRSGTMQIARELLDESIRPGVREAAVTDQRNHLVEALGSDHGIADRGTRVRDTIRQIRPGITSTTHAWLSLDEHTSRMQSDYLENWARAMEAPTTTTPIDTEGAARRIAAHLIESGMHKNSLYAWLRSVQRSPSPISIGDFLREADVRLKKAKHVYTFCVPIQTRPRFDTSSSSSLGWLNPAETTSWKAQNAPSAPPIRHQGSFLIQAAAHDVNAAADHARAQIANLNSKFQLIVGRPIVISKSMWSLEKGSEFPSQATNRLINVQSFERLGKTADLTMPDYIVSILALLQPLRTGAPHLAIVSGWSALESLLVGPQDDDIVAAERFSRIVAASVVRAELSWQSTSYSQNNDSPEARAMRDCTENIQRARLYEMLVGSEVDIDLGSATENLALSRIRPAVTRPKAEIEKITRILSREFTRMYRKRNMIVHGGQILENNLGPISETLTPLIGAGIDRIVHVGLKFNVPPIQLSALAETRVQYLNAATELAPGNVLDLLEF